MAKADDYTLAERDATDIIRTVVRLKHRIAQRHELNELEDKMLGELRAAAKEQRAYELPITSLVAEALDEPAE